MIIGCNNEITEVHYSGYTIDKIYACGGSLVYDANPGIPVIIYDYAEKQRSGQSLQYVDLVSGMKSLSNPKLVIKAMFTYNNLWSNPNNRHRLFGWNGGDGYVNTMGQNCKAYYLQNIYGISSSASIRDPRLLDMKTVNWFTFTFNIIYPNSNIGNVSIYNETEQKYEVENVTITISDVFSIFSIEGSGKICYVKVYDGDTLVNSFVPGLTKSGNSPVMYDEITGNSVSLPGNITLGNL
jgi:hypothetical protein